MTEDFDHFWNQLNVEDKIDALYSTVVEKCSEMKTLIKSFQMYTDMQRNRVVEERTLFAEKYAAQNAANAERSIAELNEIDVIVHQLLETSDIIEANQLFANLKAKVFDNEVDEHEDNDTKQLMERLELRLEREQRQRAKHMLECTSRLQDLHDQKAAAIAEYQPSLNELLASSRNKFKALLKESYDVVRLAAAKELQQQIRSRETAIQKKHEEKLLREAQLNNEQLELQYGLTETLDRARMIAMNRPEEMRAEIFEIDKQLEEATLESDDLRDTLLKSKQNLQLQAEVAKHNQLLRFQTDTGIILQITKLTAQRDKLQKKYDQLLEQITFRRNHYRATKLETFS